MKKIIILSILLSILNVQCVKADNIAEHTFVVKTTNKSCSQRSVTKKIDGKNYTFKWNIVFSVKYSYNPSTYKIGTIYSTSIHLDNQKNLYSGFSTPKITNLYNPKAIKSADGLSIKVTAKYELKVQQNISYKNISLGIYEDQTIMSV